jgi:hypothetical protein
MFRGAFQPVPRDQRGQARSGSPRRMAVAGAGEPHPRQSPRDCRRDLSSFSMTWAGGAEGNRTPDLCSAIAALSHLSYSPAPPAGCVPDGIGPPRSGSTSCDFPPLQSPVPQAFRPAELERRDGNGGRRRLVFPDRSVRARSQLRGPLSPRRWRAEPPRGRLTRPGGAVPFTAGSFLFPSLSREG